MFSNSFFAMQICPRLIFFDRCNYMGFLQDGAPLDQPTIVTRLIQPIYDEVSEESSR